MRNKITKTIRAFHNKDIVWTDTYLSNTPIHAGYFVQNRLKKAIESQTSRAKGVFLDVGCGIKPYEQIFSKCVDRYYGIEYSVDSGYRENVQMSLLMLANFLLLMNALIRFYVLK